MDKKMEKDSKLLSYYLRHHPEEAGCKIDCYGWVDVETLVKNTNFTLSYLKEIVENDTRYIFTHDYKKIRAFHGHSVEGIIYQNESIPPKELFHGTSISNLEFIKKDGLIKGMTRVQVHLSDTLEKAKKIGTRHGDPVVLIVDAEKMNADGFKFYKSGDGVWLTGDIPIKYVKKNKT